MPYSPEYNKKWYAEKKDPLLKRRRERYATDPVLRELKKKQAAEQRERNRPVKTLPDSYNLSFDRAAQMLNVTIWVIRGWVENKYIPQPLKEGRQFWFTSNQVQLMASLKEFLNDNGVRVGKNKRGKLEEFSNWLWANWQVGE